MVIGDRRRKKLKVFKDMKSKRRNPNDQKAFEKCSACW